MKLVDLGYRRAKAVKAANKALDTGKIVKDSKKSNRPPQRTQSRTEEMQDLFQSDMSLGKQNRKSGGTGKKKSKNSFKSKSRYEALLLVICYIHNQSVFSSDSLKWNSLFAFSS